MVLCTLIMIHPCLPVGCSRIVSHLQLTITVVSYSNDSEGQNNLSDDRDIWYLIGNTRGSIFESIINA